MFLKSVVFSLLFPSLAFAGQLKVVDSQGLIRAEKKITVPGKVVVVLRDGNKAPESGSGIYLSNTDGIAPDIAGVEGPPLEYNFQGVREGTWQIKSLKHGISDISKVRIIE